MRSLPKANIALAYSGVTLVLCAVFFRAWPLRGWAGVIGFTLVGITIAVSDSKLPRRYTAALGAYLMLAGADFGLSRIWVERPAWIESSGVALLAASAIWLFVEFLRVLRHPP
jgi:hypothetical protein